MTITPSSQESDGSNSLITTDLIVSNPFVSDYLERLEKRRDQKLTDDALDFNIRATFASLTQKMKEEADYFFQHKGLFPQIFAKRNPALPMLLRRSEQESELWREMTLDTHFYAAFQSLVLPRWAVEKGYFFHRSYVKDAALFFAPKDDAGMAYGVILSDRVYDHDLRRRRLARVILLAVAICILMAQRLLSLPASVLIVPAVIGILLLLRPAKLDTRRKKEDYDTLKGMAFARFQERLRRKKGVIRSALSRSERVNNAACYDELIRMLTLFSRSPGLATRSECVDMMWHEFISDTRLYRSLCLNIMGCEAIIPHVPATQVNDPQIVERYQAFLNSYMEEYRVAPPRRFWPYEISTRATQLRMSASSPSSPTYADSHNNGVDVFLPYGLFGLGCSVGNEEASAASQTIHSDTGSTSTHSGYDGSGNDGYGDNQSDCGYGGSDSSGGGSDGGSCGGDSGGSGCSGGCSC